MVLGSKPVQGHFSDVKPWGGQTPLSQSHFMDVFLVFSFLLLKLTNSQFQDTFLDLGWDHHLSLQCYFMPKFWYFPGFQCSLARLALPNLIHYKTFPTFLLCFWDSVAPGENYLWIYDDLEETRT